TSPSTPLPFIDLSFTHLRTCCLQNVLFTGTLQFPQTLTRLRIESPTWLSVDVFKNILECVQNSHINELVITNISGSLDIHTTVDVIHTDLRNLDRIVEIDISDPNREYSEEQQFMIFD